MATEITNKPCSHVACKCNSTADSGDCCSEFCKNVESSEDAQNCGCGHTACDMSKELGNENTFAPTGS